MTEHGVEIIETDLGERIQQLDDEAPSHLVVPAVHKLRSDVARVFAEKLGSDPDAQDVHYLAERSALPSFVQTTTVPVSATAKLHPVIPASAEMIRGRVASLCVSAR